MRNLVISLFEHGQIETTQAKAKEMRSLAERVITYGKKGSLHHKRLTFAVVHDHALVKKIFDDIAPKYANRNGGYTSIIKTRIRRGDAAPMAIIRLVEGEIVAKKETDNIKAADLNK